MDLESIKDSSQESEIKLSPVYTYSGKACQYSPNGEWILFTNGKEVSVMRSDSQFIEFTLFCSDRVDSAEWSPDSSFILCIVRRSNSIEVFSINDLTWNCSFTDEKMSIVSAIWSPDCSNIISISDNGLQLSIWSICSKRVYILPGIRDLRKCCRFSKDGTWLTLLRRKFITATHQADELLIYYTVNWELVRSFEVATTQALSVEWDTDNASIIVIDHPLYQRIYVYSLQGDIKYQYDENSSLGFATIQTAHEKPIACVAGYDGKMVIIDTQLMTEIREISIFSDCGTKESLVCVERLKSDVLAKYRRNHNLGIDPERKFDAYENCVLSAQGDHFFEMDVFSPITETTTAVMNRIISSRDIGIHRFHISQSDRYIAIMENSASSMLWIWDIKRDQLLIVIVFSSRIISCDWSTKNDRLAIISENQKLYFWEPGSIVWSVLPNRISKLKSVFWRDQDKQLILIGEDSFQLCDIK